MIIVCDSTTLIILHDLQKLQYLNNLFEKVLIPKAVYNEINYKNDFLLPINFEVIEVDKDSDYEILCELLDIGESEAITLSLQKQLPLIIDEKKGRKIAKNMGIEIIGLLGVLYLNIQKGFLSKKEVENFLKDALKNGYRISPKLIEQMFDSLKGNNNG
jgi:predicted nucleic acid-binding protein